MRSEETTRRDDALSVVMKFFCIQYKERGNSKLFSYMDGHPCKIKNNVAGFLHNFLISMAKLCHFATCM